MKFIHEKFLLQNASAVRLYQEFAKPEPIFDYHCHLSPKDIAENRQFKNLSEIWLEGDHYKWRAMRANGIGEQFCTGAASPWEKFQAWAATVPRTLRNPLYHWTHLELSRYFGIHQLLNEASAKSIWDQAGEKLASSEFSARGILKKFRVTTLCTTDDPVDDLQFHQKIGSSGMETKVLPAFRPDRALAVDQPEAFNGWIQKLTRAANQDIVDLKSFLEALQSRHEAFHSMGCRLSDHGLGQCFAAPCPEKKAASIFSQALQGVAATPEEQTGFATFLMLFFGRLDAEKGWVKQLHLGALRNVNTRRWRELGPDTGFDTMGDRPQGAALARFLDLLERENALPKTILYNINPADNYLFAALAGSFQDGVVPGKIQFGSGWWFLDQKEGIEWQLNALSNLGLLSRFVGMVTDSRSFMSYPRHEYFRRILCNQMGKEMEEGLLPKDDLLIGGMIRDICHNNARDYFPFSETASPIGKRRKPQPVN